MLRVKKKMLENGTKKPTRAPESSDSLQKEKVQQHTEPGSAWSGLRRVP